MSLVGNLEDLGLGEILQIVSLSRKSGVLQLNSCEREGRVIFHDGQVIRASASTFPENIGDLVLRAGLADMATLKKVLVIQKNRDDNRRIGDVLVSDFGVDREAIEKAVREQVEKVIYSFFSWDEGSFSFELGDPGEMADTNLNPLQFMLDSGLNPQWLAMEGSRLLDEKRHRGEAFEEGSESLVDIDQLLAEVNGEASHGKPIDEDSQTHSTVPLCVRKFIVVDDDPGTAEQIASLLQERRAQVHVFTNYHSFMEAVKVADPQSTTLVIDLIMPRRDGSGVLGGLELLQEVRDRYPEFQVLVMSDHPNQEAEQSVRKFGVPTLFPKPKKTDVFDERGRDGLIALVDAMITLGDRPDEDPPAKQDLYNIGAELLKEMGEVATGASPQIPQQSPGLHLLRGMLQELNNPSLGGGIILLILRFASELMNRAVILLVKEEEIVGLGQFGIEMDGESADIRVRNTRLPKTEKHVFTEALKSFAPYRSEPRETEWNDYFFTHLGGKRPDEVFVGPLISEGRVVAVLYGDNLPDEKPIGDTESLEIFLSQAGLAMEKALLERRMMSHRNTV
ncbi:MAG: response regulator [Desulfuromonadales bacterium]|nr:response regulator [Desulfuromonadales bacterium]